MRHAAIWLAALAFGLGGCAGPPPPPAGPTDQLRIVSLNPCSDAILAEIAPGKLVAVSHYSHDPSTGSMPVDRAHRWPSTGGSVEEILAMDADMVVASTFLPPATRSALDKLDIPVVTLGMENTVAGSLGQVRKLAVEVGEAQGGEALAHRIETAIARAAPGEGGASPTTILWQPGGIVPGEGALVVDLMRRLGLRPASATRGLGQGDRLPLEAVLADPPELLLHAGPSGDEESRTLHHPALRKLAMRRAEFSPQLYFCGGPSLIRAAERLAEIRDEQA